MFWGKVSHRVIWQLTPKQFCKNNSVSQINEYTFFFFSLLLKVDSFLIQYASCLRAEAYFYSFCYIFKAFCFYSLVVSYTYTVNLDHLHSSVPSISYTTQSLIFFLNSYLLFLNTLSPMRTVQVDAWKVRISLPQNHQVPITPQWHVSLVSTNFVQGRMLTGLIVGWSCACNHSCWEYEYTVSVMSQRWLHSSPSWPSALFFCSLTHDMSLTNAHLHLDTHVFCVCWPFVSLFVNHHPLRKAYPMMVSWVLHWSMITTINTWKEVWYSVYLKNNGTWFILRDYKFPSHDPWSHECPPVKQALSQLWICWLLVAPWTTRQNNCF